MCVEALPEHDRIISGSSDSTIRTWDVSQGCCLQTINHTASKCFTLLEGRLVSVSTNTIKIWDLSCPLSCSQPLTLTDSEHAFTSVTVLPNGRLASASTDGRIKIWCDPFREAEQRIARDVARQRACDDVVSVIKKFL